MKILIDTDVLRDVALAREPDLNASAQVLRWAESDGADAAVAWYSLTNISYLLEGSGHAFLKRLLSFMMVANVGNVDARRALAVQTRDLEDAFQSEAALAWGADFIITRNLSNYRQYPVPPLTPVAFLKKASLGGQAGDVR